MAFQLTASQLGFNVAKPFGDNVAYDFITEWEGLMCRIQVKSCRFFQRDRFRVHVSKGGKNQKYTKKDCDFIAAYVSTEDAWYIVPIEDVDGLNMDLRPNRNSKGKYEKFLEAWEHLK